MESILFTLGGTPVTLGMAGLGLAIVLLLVLIAYVARLGRERGLESLAQLEQASEAEERVADLVRMQSELAGRLQAMGEILSTRQSELARTVAERLDAIGQKVGENLSTGAKSTAEQLQKLEARLAVIDAAQQNIGALSDHVVGLKALLANKPARGAFGQGQMEAIVKDSLPASAYTFQGTLPNNTRPDCLIHLPGDARPLAVDAKFPLEAFEELRRAESAEAEKTALSRLRADMIGHVQDVRKYLLPNETQEVVLLFVPSEALYAELQERLEDVIHRAHKARVLIVSPSLLMLAIQVVQSLVRDAAMREQTHLIQKEVGALIEDVGRLAKRVSNLKQHMALTNKDLDEIETSANKIDKRGQRIEQMEFEDGPRETALPNPILSRDAAE